MQRYFNDFKSVDDVKREFASGYRLCDKDPNEIQLEDAEVLFASYGGGCSCIL